MREATCISNIAWPAEADQEALDLVGELGFSGVELAPTKVFGPWDQISLSAVADYRDRLADKHLSIPSFQGILYGAGHLNIFGDATIRGELRRHFAQVARIGSAAGAGNLVFGAPGARDPGNLAPEEAFDLAVDFFRDVSAVFESEGVQLAFEANTADWGCRFITTTAEAARLVQAVDRPGIRLQLDTGTAFSNGESWESWTEYVSLASHLHVSEPRLLPAGSCNNNHALVGAMLHEHGYQGWRSIEMKAVDDWRQRIVAAVEILQACY